VKTIDSQKVKAAFQGYPEEISQGLMVFRALIYEVAADHEPAIVIEESLRWSEPAYLCKTGSTIRLGYKKSNLSEYGMYFNCKSQLISLFKRSTRLSFNMKEIVP
jgi:hypothetical protein